MTKMPQHALLTELTGCCQLTDGMAGWVREHGGCAITTDAFAVVHGDDSR